MPKQPAHWLEVQAQHYARQSQSRAAGERLRKVMALKPVEEVRYSVTEWRRAREREQRFWYWAMIIGLGGAIIFAALA